MAEVTHGYPSDRDVNRAVLYVRRWNSYRGSPHIRRRDDDALVRLNRMLSDQGRNPPGHDPSEPDYCHVLRNAIGDLTDLDPSPQEAWLTVELAGRSIGFRRWRFLAEHGTRLGSWSWLERGGGNGQGEACAECLKLLRLLAVELGRRFKP